MRLFFGNITKTNKTKVDDHVIAEATAGSHTKTGHLLSQIIERFPVELCRRKRVDEDEIILERGAVFRRQWVEKRRENMSEDAILEEETRQGPLRNIAARLRRQDNLEEALEKELEEELEVEVACETVGSESRIIREIQCEEIQEIQCETINVTKHRQEIVTRCQTLVDQQCNVTYVDVPSQQCQERSRNRCETVFRLVEYREECKVDVQHICDQCEHQVPVVLNTTEPADEQPVETERSSGDSQDELREILSNVTTAEPVVTTQEFPAPQGCRSIQVKECTKFPIIVPRAVPYEVS